MLAAAGCAESPVASWVGSMPASTWPTSLPPLRAPGQPARQTQATIQQLVDQPGLRFLEPIMRVTYADARPDALSLHANSLIRCATGNATNDAAAYMCPPTWVALHLCYVPKLVTLS